MDNSDYSPLQQTERYKTLFSVAVAIVFNGYGISVEHGVNVNKINSVLVKISKTLFFIPFKLHHSTIAGLPLL